MERITIDFSNRTFIATGGSPRGGDVVHNTIGSWPGWRRVARSNADVSTYHAPAYVSCVLGVDGRALDITWTPAGIKARDALLKQLQDARTALAHPSRLPGAHRGLPTRREPLDHQWGAIEALRHMGWRALLCDDMGLGKSATALWSLLDAGAINMLIVCPASVKHNWKRELFATLGEGWDAIVIDGPPAKRATLISELVHAGTANAGKPICGIINYDLLPHTTPEQLDALRAFVKGEALICDEAHYLKNRTAKRTKACAYLASEARQRLLLTGTPIRNLADDLFQQIEVVRPGTWTSYQDFANRHLVIQQIDFGNGRPTPKIVAAKNLDDLNKVVNTCKVGRKKEEVLNLPPRIHTYPELELGSTERRLYRAMKEFAKIALSQLDPETTIFDPQAKSAVETVLRCEQLAQGFIGGIPEPLMEQFSGAAVKGAERIPGRPNELIFPQAAKLSWLVETIEDLLAQDSNVLVFTRFNAPLFWLPSRINANVTLLHGGLTSGEKDDAITGFQAGKARVLVAQVKMAEGWNATRAQDVLFLGRDWSPAINDQAESRAHRMGQKGTVNVQIPIVLDTVEVPIHKRLRAKANAAESALRNVTVHELMGWL